MTTQPASSQTADSQSGASKSVEVFQSLPHAARVLVIRLRSLGDIVLMTPALRLLHEWRPDLRVTVLAEQPWNELLANNPAIESVMVLRGKLGTAWRLRQAGFALAINLHGGPTSALLTRASGARWRAGFEHFRDQYAYNLRVPKAQQILGCTRAVHTAEHVASCFFWLGVPRAEIPRAQVFPAPAACRSVAARLAAMGISEGERYAVIHPVATYASKQWKASGFAEISDFIGDQFGWRSVCLCGAGEAAVLDEVAKHCTRPLLRAEGWSIPELMALIASARVFVGNDSGPAHSAAAAGIPVLAIFGSSHSAVWRPWRAAASEVVQNDFPCNPCPGDRCYAFEEPRCILSITTEQVKESLERLLEPTAGKEFTAENTESTEIKN